MLDHLETIKLQGARIVKKWRSAKNNDGRAGEESDNQYQYPNRPRKREL